ncbi:hypothetical protein DEIPH_ctg103orf0093 [Deinococcus phoenicis]|uniref:Diguanylate cyclase n=1 Tax=Deinococcus phoenicis TaxID=1476583 RepID=A0A016QLD4_9DEIO|nr:hypothetical protein DEIPH_ctg103orf0093 [Deinococcus phoenicis]
MLVSCAFLLSLTFREWPVRPRLSEDALRVVLAAVIICLLMVYSAPFGPFRVDLRFVVVALVTLRYGVGVGVLAFLPALALRFLEDRTAAGVAAVNGLSVVLLTGWLRPHLSVPRLTLRQLWLAPVPFLGLSLALLLTPQGRGVFPVVYPLGLSFSALGLVIALGIFQSRLRLLRLTHRLRAEALSDPLTGLGNRRRFDADLMALPAGRQLVLLDVDHFKAVNDLYGHAAGDRVLEQMGRLLREQAPAHLRAYRIGGEEFALLADTGGEEQTRALVEEVRRRVPQMLVGHIGGVTLSAGMSTRRPDDTPSALFQRADEALYLAKTNGRDRLVTSEAVTRAPAPLEAAEPGSAGTPLQPLQPRHSLWRALRTTIALLGERRTLGDEDWQELLHLAVAAVDGAEAGSLNIREGRRFRICAAEGFAPGLLGVRIEEAAQLDWYGRSREEWQAGAARVLKTDELRRVYASTDPVLRDAGSVFERAGQRSEIRADLCFPVVLRGDVVAHLNFDSFTSEDAFTWQSVEIAGLFAQQFAALLHLQERWRELDLLGQLHAKVGTDPQGRSAEVQLTETAVDLLQAAQATLLRYDAAGDQLVSAATEGTYRELGPVCLPRGQGVSWEALATGRVVRVANTRGDGRVYRRDRLAGDAMMAVPLLDGDHQPLGVLVLTRDASRPFLPDDESLALLLASVAARMFERMAYLAGLRATLEAALTTLGVALEARDFETQGHTERVLRYAERFGTELGLSEDRLTALRHGAMLHDIGKLGIPDAVLLKPGALTPGEREVVEGHAVIGAALADRIPFLHPEAHGVIRSHHERWDGRGYPGGLGGEDIPLLARLFALCDVYDALVSTRPYKQAMPPEQALGILRAGRGTQFDPELTDLFEQLWHAGAFR